MPRSEASKEASKAAAIRYKAAKIKRVPLDMQRTQYEAVQAHAQAQGESVNGFIKRAIAQTMARDNAAPGAAGGAADAEEGDT